MDKNLRLFLALLAAVCTIAVVVMSLYGMEHRFTDGMLLIMKLLGGVAVLSLIGNAAAAVYLLKSKGEK